MAQSLENRLALTKSTQESWEMETVTEVKTMGKTPKDRCIMTREQGRHNLGDLDSCDNNIRSPGDAGKITASESRRSE